MKRPTIADIARRAGVSKGAVSYALNGQAGVSEATRSRVRAIAAELGWSPHTAARALSGAPAYAIGLVICRPARVLGVEPFFMSLVSGLEAELSARSYALTLQLVTDTAAELAVYRRWWAERRVDGVVLVDLRADDPRGAELAKLGLPAVAIGDPSGSGALAGIWSDEAGALADVVDYLVALGHRRIARVSGRPDLLHTRIRDEAFAAACTRAGLPGHTVVPADYTGTTSASVTRRLIGSRTPPTAIVYDNDVMALAGLAVAQEMGRPVPAELSIVAWDDSPLCQLVHPPLTAVTRDIPAHGGHAARHLLSVIGGEPVDDFEDEPARLVPRGSTGPAPADRFAAG